MAQVIQPEVWVQGLEDNMLLPGRYTTGLFIGNSGLGRDIANNPEATVIWDIQIPDYITDYDDRRLNGHSNVEGMTGFNADGRDGWGASAYGVFQDVHFDSRIYTMGRHRSVAFRIFEEKQYSGAIGKWGTETTSNVVSTGTSLMQVAAQITKARDLWEKQILGPDIDKYNIFAVLNGHISGRWVQTNPDQIFSDDGQWIAQPGSWQGEPIPPRFAPIHCIEWSNDDIPLLLNNISVTWDNLMIPDDSRVILLDKFYRYYLMLALTGNGVPATEAAYSDVRDANFSRLMGWDFDFSIPTQYWPRLYVDANLNVVHSANGQATYDQYMRSISHAGEGDKQLMMELVDAGRMNTVNYVKTVWDTTDLEYKKVITNYPLGMPSSVDYYGNPITVAEGTDAVDAAYSLPDTYPFRGPGSGYGLPVGVTGATGATGPSGQIKRVQVIGCALYKKAAQLSQEYSAMVTGEGGTRGKFTECCMDVKYDAWVIEQLSAGILPIIDESADQGEFAIPVKIIGQS